MFPTTEPVSGEKLKTGSFASKLMAKFVDLCDEVGKMRLCISLTTSEMLLFRNLKQRHSSTTPGCGCTPKVSL